MQQEQVNIRDLMTMVNSFSGCKIDPKYFPDMFKSPFIIESLKTIYMLQHNRKLNREDMLKIKQIFQDYFSFFGVPYNPQASKKYNKKYLILSVVFFNLLLVSAVGCGYFPIIFIPLAFNFFIYLVVCGCLINTPACRPCPLPSNEDNIENCKDEFFALKYNLNQLTNFLVNKYQIKNVNDFFKSSDKAASNCKTAKNSINEKKTVSFAPKLNEFFLFFEESSEIRSRTNSYDNSQHPNL